MLITLASPSNGALAYELIYMFSSDGESQYRELQGATGAEIKASGDWRIVGIGIQQENVASVSEVKCGTSTIARNYGKDLPFQETNFHCVNSINLSKTGNDKASYIITYEPYSSASRSSQINFNNDTLVGINGAVWVLWVALGLLIFAQFIHLGLWLFRK